MLEITVTGEYGWTPRGLLSVLLPSLKVLDGGWRSRNDRSGRSRPRYGVVRDRVGVGCRCLPSIHPSLGDARSGSTPGPSHCTPRLTAAGVRSPDPQKPTTVDITPSSLTPLSLSGGPESRSSRILNLDSTLFVETLLCTKHFPAREITGWDCGEGSPLLLPEWT